MTMEWGNDLVMQFIELYKREPVLWCTDTYQNRDRRLVSAAWERIGKVMNIEVADLKRKKDSIKASYRGLLRKKLAAQKAGQPYKPVWFAFDALESFLSPNIKNGQNIEIDLQEGTLDHADEVDTSEPEQMVEYLQDSDFEDHTDVQFQTDPIKEEIEPAPKYRQNRTQKPRVTALRRPKLTIKRPVKNNSNASEMRILEALRTLKQTDDVKRKKDECDTFGEYIAESLRKHDERTQCMIKQAINNILFEQEMKKYNSEQYVVISNVDNTLILGDQDDK